MQAYTPIQLLTPVMDSWSIKAKVTDKGDLRTFTNARGEGSVFGIELLDKDGGQIKGSFFNDDAVKWHKAIEAGKVYEFSNGYIKVANQRFQKCDNEYAITFSYNTKISECKNEEISAQKLKFKFTEISKIPDIKDGTFLDVLAFVVMAHQADEVSLKSGGTKLRRNIVIADPSNKSVRLTIWGEDCNNKRFEKNGVFAIKNARVREWKEQKSIGLTYKSVIQDELDEKDQQLMQQFIASKGDTIEMIAGGEEVQGGSKNRTIHSIGFIKQCEDESRFSEDPTFFQIIGTVTAIRQKSMWYQACPQCRKKVFEEGDGFQCPNCQWEGKECNLKYILSAKVSDGTNEMWVSVYDPNGSVVMRGKSAQEVKPMYDQKNNQMDDKPFNAFLKTVRYQQYSIGVKAILRQNNMGEMQTRYSATWVKPVFAKKNNDTMIEMLTKYHAMKRGNQKMDEEQIVQNVQVV